MNANESRASIDIALADSYSPGEDTSEVWTLRETRGGPDSVDKGAYMPAAAQHLKANRRPARLRSLAALLLAAALAVPAAPTHGDAAVPDAHPLLVVDGFHGSFAGQTYRAAPSDVLDGGLARARGTETIGPDKISLAGGDSGLAFQPSTPPDRGLIVEAVVKRTAAWVPDDDVLDIGGTAFYRYRADDSYITEFGGTKTTAAYGIPSATYRHIALVDADGAVTAYVDGVAVGTEPASAPSSPLIGFGMDPTEPGHGLPADLSGVAVSTFTGSFSTADFQLHAPPQQTVNGPGNVVTLSPSDSQADAVRKATQVLPTPIEVNYQRREFEAFLHFGVNTFTGSDGVEVGDGSTPPSAFNPTHLDPAQWVAALKDAGVTTAVLITKHHDGFVNWPSRYTDYGVKSSPWQNGRGDVVREFVDAAHAAGMKVGFYLSPADNHQWANGSGIYNNGSVWRPTTIPTLVPNDDRTAAVQSGKQPTFHFDLDDYNRYYTNELYELLTQYGPVDEVWLDGNNAIKAAHPDVTITEHYAYADWYQMIRALQPRAVIETGPRSQPPNQSYAGPDARWVGSNAGSREQEWNVLPMNGDPTSQVGVSPVRNKVLGTDDQLAGHDYLKWIPAMADTSIRPGWFYHPSQDGSVKSLADLEQLYLNTVGRNSVLLLNVPPDGDGVLNPIDVDRLHQVGEWIRATFGTDLARGATVTDPIGGIGHVDAVVDGNADSYWSPGGQATAGELDLDLAKPTTFDVVGLQEPIRRGQRVSSFAVDAWDGTGWTQVSSGSTIGYKRLIRLAAPVTAQRVRLRILGSRATPMISTVGLYDEPSGSGK